jgi:hypothetical protein
MRKKLNWYDAGHSERLRAQHSTAVSQRQGKEAQKLPSVLDH